MKLSYGSVWSVLGAAALWTASASGGPADSSTERNLFRTNKINRWITNVIEVTVPDNRFINFYQTNWVPRIHTNTVDVFATNIVTRTITNEVLRTAYFTNFKTINLTNLETVVMLQTNWIRQPKTNVVTVQAYITNLVTDYQTNYRTLTFTNWQPVVVMKTNWVNRPVTNVVEIEVMTDGTGPAVVNSEASNDEPAPLGAVVLASDLLLEATRSAKTLPNRAVEVLLKVSARGKQAVRVQQWRVESEDGAVLCFGQDTDFKRALPVGRYKVEVRAKKDAAGSLLIARGVLGITSQEVWIEPKPLALK